ncbi:endonuclease [Salinibacter phage M8CRM-1]|uniref:Endonuclease n=1 Tax=Salinibacter phage M8CRM-1 TaxID=2681612 RepID=A0A2I6UGN9_9CAUD|nr:HNH endonuclease [Salinibacter phage M8CRM-1]AUO79145.1 endonuclease [Salinibacter phage M8CRM-1]
MINFYVVPTALKEFVGEEVAVAPVNTEGDYYVTDDGRVISIKSGSPKVLKPWIHPDGYERIHLYLEDGREKQYVHRLVAFAFVEGYFKNAEVNHKNGDKRDNRPSNLEWITKAENVRHAHRNSFRKPTHEYIEDRYGV